METNSQKEKINLRQMEIVFLSFKAESLTDNWNFSGGIHKKHGSGGIPEKSRIDKENMNQEKPPVANFSGNQMEGIITLTVNRGVGQKMSLMNASIQWDEFGHH